MAKQQIRMRIICVDPMRHCPGIDAIQFGLQDKKQDLHWGREVAADAVSFEFTLDVRRHNDGWPNFTGAFAHGTREKRFVYLTYKVPDGESWQIYRRLKVPLHEISWEQVEAALAEGQALQARVSGLRSGTVPLLHGGWMASD